MVFLISMFHVGVFNLAEWSKSKNPDKETDVTMDDRVLVDTHRVRQWGCQLLNEDVTRVEVIMHESHILKHEECISDLE